MKRIINLLGRMPAFVWLGICFFLIFKVFMMWMARQAQELEYEYYDTGYSYRTPRIEAEEEKNRKKDERYLNSLSADDKNKALLVEVYNKRYKGT